MGASIGSSASDAGEADDPYVSDQGGSECSEMASLRMAFGASFTRRLIENSRYGGSSAHSQDRSFLL